MAITDNPLSSEEPTASQVYDLPTTETPRANIGGEIVDAPSLGMEEGGGEIDPKNSDLKERHEQLEQNKADLKANFQRSAQKQIDGYLLDWDKFKPNEDDGLRRRRIVRGILHSELGDSPPTTMGYRLARRRAAVKLFGEDVGHSDESFVAAAMERATKTKETIDFYDNLDSQATLSALLGGGQIESAFRKEAQNDPVWRREKDRAMQQWRDNKEQLNEEFGDLIPEVRKLWGMINQDKVDFLKVSNIVAKMDDDELAGAAMLLGKIQELQESKGSDRGVLDNAAEQTGRDAERTASGLKGAAIRFFSKVAEGNYVIGEEYTGLDNSEFIEGEQGRQEAVERAERFMAEIRRFRDQRDPILRKAKEGTALGYAEGFLYQTPGVGMTVATSAIPIVGQANTLSLLKQSFADQGYLRAIDAGVERGRAREIVNEVALPIVALQYLPERLGLGAVTRKLPFLSKALDKLPGALQGKLARITAGTVARNLGESGTEEVQAILTEIGNDMLTALEKDIPEADWAAHWENFGHRNIETFLSIAPYSALGAVRHDSGIGKAIESASGATRDQLIASGFKSEDVDSFQSSEGKLAQRAALEKMLSGQDPTTSETKAAVQREIATQKKSKEAYEELENVGAIPGVRTSQEEEGFEVYEAETGDTIAVVETPEEAANVVLDTIGMTDRATQEHVDELVSMFEAGKKIASETGVDQNMELTRGMNIQKMSEMFDGVEARMEKQLELKEQMEGGSGEIARTVMRFSPIDGVNVPRGSQNNKEEFTMSFKNSSIFTLVHERAHSVRRELLRLGEVTKEEQVQFFRKLNKTLKGKETREGLAMEFAGIGEGEVSETALDEAWAEFSEVMLLKSRNGKKSEMRELLNKNLKAMVLNRTPGASKFASFIRAMREFFGLNLSRAAALDKAERSGDLDAAEMERFRAMVMGETLQDQYEREVVENFEDNFVPSDDVPFSIAGDAAGRSLLDFDYLAAVESGDVEAQQAMVDAKAKAAGLARLLRGGNLDEKRLTRGTWFSDSAAGSSSFGEVSSYFVDTGSKLDLRNSKSLSDFISDIDTPLEAVTSKAELIDQAESEGITDWYWQGAILKKAEDEGFDSAVFLDENSTEGRGSIGYTSTVVFNPDQIKSADPITRDADGNVIPLSERFDESRDEVSFSLGNSTVTPNAETKTYPTKDSGVVGPASFSITAHHGTPHKLGKFSTDKIGTGEGAQAYGWGLYFAESPELAQQYRENLSNQSRFLPQWLLDGKSSTDAGIPDIIFLENIGIDGEIETERKRLESRIRSAKKNSDLWTDADQVIKGAEEGLMWLEENQDAAERVSYEERKGSLYTVDLNVEQDELLDWDKPLSQQSEKVRDVLSEMGYVSKETGYFEDTGSEIYVSLGGDVYVGGVAAGNSQVASEALSALGIKGIRYLDGDSRADGEGTSNYVIFNDADIKITEENGQVVDTSSPSFSLGDSRMPTTPQEISEAKEPIVEQIYLKETEKFKKGMESGRIKTNADIRNFIGQHMVMHQPDTAMTGEVRVDGESFVMGKGGVYFPVLFSEEGYFWASTAAKVEEMAGALNEISERNGGKIYMALTSADVDKLFSSTTMSVGTMNFFKQLSKNPRKYGITEAQLNKMLIQASKTQIVSKLLIKGKDGKPVLNKKGEKTYKVKTQEFGHTLSKGSKLNDTMTELEGWLQPFSEDKSTGSSFDVRKSFVFDLMRQVSTHLKGKPAQSKAVAGLLTQESNEFAKNKVIKGDLSLAAFAQGLGDMLSEPLTKTFQKFGKKGKGYIYAVIEIEGKVKAIDIKGHESYPKAIVSAEGKLPTVHVMKDGYHWTDVVQEKDTGARVERVATEMAKVYPTGGFSAYKGRPLQFGEVQENAEGVELSFSLGQEKLLGFSSEELQQKDADYLAAVESGDVEAQQRMVDAAIQNSKYKAKGVRAGVYRDGVPLLPSKRALLGSGFYAILDGKKEDVRQFAGPLVGPERNDKSLESRVDDLAIDLGDNPIFLDGTDGINKYIRENGLEEQFETWLAYQDAVNTAYKSVGGERPESLETVRGGTIQRDLENVDTYAGAGFKSQNTRDDANFLLDRVVSAIVVDHSKSDGEREFKEVVVANPNQIKSAEPVTRGANGNVIPLSQRFDEKDDRISFSLGNSAMVDSIISDVTARVRDPEARADLFENVILKVDELKRDTDKKIFGGTVTQKAIVEPRKMKSLRKEAAMRQALRYDDLETKVLQEEGAALAQGDAMTLKDMPLHGFIARPGNGLAGGSMESKSAFVKRTGRDAGAEYEGSEGMVGGLLYGGSRAPDQMASELYREGLIAEDSTALMWDLLASERASVKDNQAEFKKALKRLAEVKKQAKTEADEWLAERVDEQTRDHNPMARLRRSLAMLDAILMALPVELRGKVGGFVQLAKLNSEEQRLEFLKGRIEKLDKVVEDWVKKETLSNIEKVRKKASAKREGGKKPKGKLGAAGHRFFDQVEAVVDLDESSLEKEESYLMAELAKPDGESKISNLDLAERLQILETFGGLKSKTAQELTAASQLAHETYRTKRNQWRMLEEARLGEVKALVAETIKALGNPDIADLQAEGEVGNDRKEALKALKSLDWTILSFAEVMEKLFGRDHPLASRWSKMVRQSMNARTTSITQAHKRWTAASEVATGKTGREAQLAVWEMQTEQTIDATPRPQEGKSMKIPIDTFKNAESRDSLGLSKEEVVRLEEQLENLPEGSRKKNLTLERMTSKAERTAKFTDSQAIYLTMLFAQDGYKDAMRKHGFGETFQEELESGMSDGAKSLREHLKQEYAGNYEPLRKIYARMFGMNLPQTENYTPGKFYSQGDDITMDVTGSGFVEGGLMTGFLKDRKKHTSEPRVESAFSVYFAHLNQTEHWKAVAEVSREIRGVFGNPKVKRALHAKNKRAAFAVGEWLKAIDGNGFNNPKSNLVFEWLMSTQAKLALAWKVSTIAKNFFGAAINQAYRMPIRDFVKGYGRLTSGKIDFKAMMASDLIQQRLDGGFAPEARAAINESLGEKPTRGNQFVMAGMDIIGKADALGTAMGSAITYDYHYHRLKKEMEHEQAHSLAMDEAAESISRTAQPVEVTDRSLMELQTTGLAKIAFIFASEARQKSAMWTQAWARTLTGKADIRDYRVLFISHFVMAPVMHGITAAVRDARNDDDDELFDEKNWGWEGWAKSVATGPLSGLPLIREVFDGFNSDDAGPLSRITRAGMSAADLLGAIFGDEDPTKEEIEWYERKITEVLQAFGAVPAVSSSAFDQAFDLFDNLGGKD